MRIFRRLRLSLLAYLQRGCAHPGAAVKADILEGDAGETHVQWCEVCGAWRLAYLGRGPGEWRAPRPDYYSPRMRSRTAASASSAV